MHSNIIIINDSTYIKIGGVILKNSSTILYKIAEIFIYNKVIKKLNIVRLLIIEKKINQWLQHS